MTVKFNLRKPKVNNKLRTEEVSIIGIFSLGRAFRFEFNTGETIVPTLWSFTQQKAKSTYRRHMELNGRLEDLKSEIRELYKKTPSLPDFKKLCQSRFKGLQIPEQKKTLFLALDEFLSQYKAEKDVKTFRKCNALKMQLTAFDQVHSIDFQTLDFKFYDRFKEFLYAVPNPNYRKYSLGFDPATDSYSLIAGADGQCVGLFDDTVYKYIINLKTFLKWAEKREYQVHQSYKSWGIVRRKHEPISLTKDELSRLQNYVYSNRSEDIARDYVLLMCLTGQRISDIKRFNVKDVSGNEWTFIQKKGQRLVNSKVTVPFEGFIAPALDILIKYNWKLPVISEQKINKHIKNACKLAGIDTSVEYIRWAQNKKIVMLAPKHEFVSCHTGRKTFITLALQEGLSIEHVMQITGISEYDTIRHYRSRFESSAIKEALGKIVMRKAQ